MIELATASVTLTSPTIQPLPLDELRLQIRTLIKGLENYHLFTQRICWLAPTYTDNTLDDFQNVVACISKNFKV